MKWAVVGGGGGGRGRGSEFGGRTENYHLSTSTSFTEDCSSTFFCLSFQLYHLSWNTSRCLALIRVKAVRKGKYIGMKIKWISNWRDCRRLNYLKVLCLAILRS